MHFIGLDTETGGFYPSIHALLSIGASCSWSGETFREYITVGGQFMAGGEGLMKIVEPEAARINGYSWDEWERRGAIPIEMAMRNLLAWIDARKKEAPRAKFVCHNLEFDRSHLREAERITGLEIPHRHDWRCSQVKFGELMDKGVIPMGSAGLDRLGELSGFWTPGQRAEVHEVVQDAEACLHGYQWLLEQERKTEDSLRLLYADSLAFRRYQEANANSTSQCMRTLVKQIEGPQANTLANLARSLEVVDLLDYPPDGLSRIFLERSRQVHVEGYTLEEDDRYVNQELLSAAAAYLLVCERHDDPQKQKFWDEGAGTWWPDSWPQESFKPYNDAGTFDARRCLEKAGALIAAELDRLGRMGMKSDGKQPVATHGKEGV